VGAVGELSPSISVQVPDVLELHAPSDISDGDEESIFGSIVKAVKSAKTASTIDMPGLATKFAVPSEVGKPINDNIAVSVMFLMGAKKQDKAMQEATDRYPAPENCAILEVPRVQPVIWDKIQQSTRSRDLKIQRVQKPLVKGITAYANELKSSSLNENQLDTLALLCHANFEMNCLRKEFIKPDINVKYVHLCKPTNPVTKWLFGDDLSQKVKDMKEEQKVAEGVMRSSPSSSRRGHSASAYHPYAGFSQRQTRRYQQAGWERRRSDQRPFLGQAQIRNNWRRNYQIRQKGANNKKDEKKR
jgi:hypothetical protein